MAKDGQTRQVAFRLPDQFLEQRELWENVSNSQYELGDFLVDVITELGDFAKRADILREFERLWNADYKKLDKIHRTCDYWTPDRREPYVDVLSFSHLTACGTYDGISEAVAQLAIDQNLNVEKTRLECRRMRGEEIEETTYLQRIRNKIEEYEPRTTEDADFKSMTLSVMQDWLDYETGRTQTTAIP